MKLLLCFLAFSISEECGDGLHAHPSKCDTFYQCANGHRYEDQKCPDGLLYNSEVKLCDWPDNVDCPAQCQDGIHPHETECNMFYQCFNGHRYENQQCPEGLFYNPEMEYCDWPSNVDCTPSSTTSTISSPLTTTSDTPNITLLSTTWDMDEKKLCPDGIYPHETDCNMFYQCANGHRYEDQRCPPGLCYNPAMEYCDFCQNVDCTLSTTTLETTTILETTTVFDNTTTEELPIYNTTFMAENQFGKSVCSDGIYPHETDCNMFYQCANGHRYEDQKCPEGLFYNDNNEQCDWPENVSCPCLVGDRKQHETDCTKFYECDQQKFNTLYSCDILHIFDEESLTCKRTFKPILCNQL